MQKLFSWVRKNWLVVILLVVIVGLIAKDKQVRFQTSINSYDRDMVEPMMMEDVAMGGEMATKSLIAPAPGYPVEEFAPTDSVDRLVITDTSLSMVVDDVSDAVKEIQVEAENRGGFLVNANVSMPEEGGTGSIVVRVPSDKRDEALESFRSLGVRVVSENVNGRDVTDQYEDLEARLEVLEKTKLKFEEILNDATRVQDLLQVQRELVNLQYQIDNVVGRQQYLEKSAALSVITVYLSTDELALPYAPEQPWRPQVIFKQAVRHLVQSGRSLAEAGIWVVVYAPVLVILAIVVWVIKRKVGK